MRFSRTMNRLNSFSKVNSPTKTVNSLFSITNSKQSSAAPLKRLRVKSSPDVHLENAARAEDAQGTPTQSHISPSILLGWEDNVTNLCWPTFAHILFRISTSWVISKTFLRQIGTEVPDEFMMFTTRVDSLRLKAWKYSQLENLSVWGLGLGVQGSGFPKWEFGAHFGISETEGGREREREREWERERVSERERECLRERECVWVSEKESLCVCVCERERETRNAEALDGVLEVRRERELRLA